MKLRYSIMDPTKNITALVEDSLPIEKQPDAAMKIMERHPEVEQVGYVCYYDKPTEDKVFGELRMAGGEFCGNATLSTGTLCIIRKGLEGELDKGPLNMKLRSSGAKEPVALQFEKDPEGGFIASAVMPRSEGIEERALSYGALSGKLPVVFMEGISHIVIKENSVFFSLLKNRDEAEAAVRAWCEELKADGLGLMFLEGAGPEYKMTPLVYVPGSGTCFWENSCASGSSATGMFLAWESGRKIDAALSEPGGVLKVSSEPMGDTRLIGRARLTGEYEIEY